MTITTTVPSPPDPTVEGLTRHEDGKAERQELARSGAGGRGLTPRQGQAVVLLAAGYTVSQAAREVGAGKRTLFRWLKQERFREELFRTRERHRHSLEGRVFSVAQEALAIVQQALRSDDLERQLTAAQLAIDSAVRMVTRYKQPQAEDGELPRVPLVVFPPGTRWPWQNGDRRDQLEPLEIGAGDVEDDAE